MIEVSDIMKEQFTDPLSRLHRGIVVSNEDPEMKCRLKVRVPGVLDGNAESLPWSTPLLNHGFGESDQFNQICIPEVGTEVTIEFPTKEIQMPSYSFRMGINQVPEPFKQNYPDRYGYIDRNGTYYYNDKRTKEFLFHHCSGFEFRIDGGGNFNLTTPGNGTSTVSSNWTFNIPDLMKVVTAMLQSTGEVEDKVRAMSGDRQIYNSHNHPGYHGPTSVPNLLK